MNETEEQFLLAVEQILQSELGSEILAYRLSIRIRDLLIRYRPLSDIPTLTTPADGR
jgi:hypothetical protein